MPYEGKEEIDTFEGRPHTETNTGLIQHEKRRKEEGMRKLILLALGAFFAAGLVLYATPSMAIHKGAGDLVCGGCHTMHSSQRGTNSLAMGGPGGSLILLRQGITKRADIHLLCLQCHSENGGQNATLQKPHDTTAPKVHLTSPYSGGSPAAFSDAVGAGGDFATGGTYAAGAWALQSGSGWDDTAEALGKIHSLGLENVAPPGNATTAIPTGTDLPYLTCTSCHDPHGTAETANANINKFRNLKAGTYIQAEAQNEWTNMSAFGVVAMSYIGGVTNTTDGGVAADAVFDLGTAPTAAGNRWPVWRASGTQNVYYQKGVSVTLGGISDAGENSTNVGISAFCAQCHGAWHEGRFSSNKATNDWNRHPVNNRILDATSLSGGNVDITRFSHYNNTGAGSSKAPFTSTDATKLPAANEDGDTEYFADTDGSKVFCLSCHFAHGSPYNDILRWDYTSAVSSGSQTGNAIASNTGCQQCHNR